MEAQVGREDNESFQHSYVLQLWELINFPHVPTPLSICSWVFRPKKSSDSPDAKRNVLVLSDASQQYTSLNFSPLYFEKILEGTVNTLLRLHAIEDGDETSAVFSTSVLQSPPSLPTPVNDSRSLEAIVNCPSCFFDVRVNAGSDGAKSKRSIDYLLGKFVLHVEENHHSICPPSSPLTCPFKACGRCRYTFKTKQGLMQHLTSVHLQQWGQATGVQPSVTYAIRGQSFFSRPMEMNYACDVLSQTPAILNTFEGRDERVERQFTMTVVANLWPIRSKGPTPNLVLVGEDSFGTDVGGWRALCAKVPRFEVTVLNQQYQHLHHLHSSLPLSHTINYSVDRYCSKKLLAAADIVLSPPTTISHNDELNRHVNFMRRLRSMVVEK
ncbi:hypothetical protein DM02DRAFT_733303 [Periconia macrospinosa]|uniref:C2H2-type domain-containing protein n=1 Tax=Periconia macrospinosa TaxID=97972 RepID=A0A2V1D596_9PLEO|nr:hypothetical protein DM02DRAFT_733303 [Periconia macrospinosa]